MASASLVSVANNMDIQSDWTLSASLNVQGYILVKKLGSAPSFTPVSGMDYEVGPIDGGREIVYKGTDNSFLDEFNPDGRYYYEVFAYSPEFLYSAAASSNAEIVHNTWAWMYGSTTTNPAMVRGTKGVASASNNPGPRSHPTVCGHGDTFYLFGGADTSNFELFADLWRFRNGEWTWLAGPTTTEQPGTYLGLAGELNAGNQPGARRDATCAVDNNGDFWMYAGEGYDGNSPVDDTASLEDLWRFDMGTQQWAYMSGKQDCSVQEDCWPYYPSETSFFDIDPKPGARIDHAMVFDYENTLFLYGGQGYIAGNSSDYLADLWRFDTADNKWVFLRGDSNLSTDSNFGSGVGSSTTIPGARSNTAIVAGREGFVIFGGYGKDKDQIEGKLSDIWSYDIISNDWSPGPANQSANQFGVYGTQGEPSGMNFPGSRVDAQIWIDAGQQIIVFGGNGYASANQGNLNDVWILGQGGWKWARGSSSRNGSESKGASGVDDKTYTPNARRGMASGIDPDTGKLLLFGAVGQDLGFAPGLLGPVGPRTIDASGTYDLWRFSTVGTLCPPFSENPSFCFAPKF
ncbi:MAG: hypothetical protein EOP06_12560 [Proteobacteria bacterium]|nr:MAG: hypothetical protein EOP06_12560 [Pseudomonadota bacterium]